MNVEGLYGVNFLKRFQVCRGAFIDEHDALRTLRALSQQARPPAALASAVLVNVLWIGAGYLIMGAPLSIAATVVLAIVIAAGFGLLAATVVWLMREKDIRRKP